MNELSLKRTTDIVKKLLIDKPECRNSDNILYYNVLKYVGQKNGVDIEKMSIPTFLLRMKDYGFPGFETVRRSRQKMQADFPELSATDEVEGYRNLKEQEYRNYAREVQHD